MEIVTGLILFGIAIFVLAIFAVIAYALWLIGRAIVGTLKSKNGLIAFLMIFTPIAPIGAVWFVMQVIRNLK